MNEPMPATTASHTRTMKAIVQREYGTFDALRLEAVEVPRIAPDEVLIRVRAASVNHADWVMTSGRPLIGRLAFGLFRPRQAVRGRDVAGTVEAVGASVTRFVPGDEVFAEVDSGSFAEYALASERLVSTKPVNLDFVSAATVPLAGRTALQGLRDAGRVLPGQRVLVNGASGGVGTFAVQIAKALGAEVTAVCSARNSALVRSLGADHVVDYAREDFTLRTAGYDVIFDLIGNHSLTALRRSLTPGGTLVLSSGTGGRVFGPMGRILRALLLSPFVGQNLRIFAPTRGAESLAALRELIESGAVTPAVDRVYPLADAAGAVRYFVEEHARGKIVITV